MLKNLTFILLSVFIILGFSTNAYAQYQARDSFYYMKDDGVFSDEEKDLEAEYAKRKCEQSVLQQKYFNCACVAGALRVERDKEKLVPQRIIMNKIYNDPKSPCVDSARIAAETYGFCMGFAKSFRTRNEEQDNESYCKCSANKVAISFAKKPALRTRYINKLQSQALTECNAEHPVVILKRR